MRGKVLKELTRHLAEAEAIVGRHGKTQVSELDLGDVATFMEVTLAMECHPSFRWSDYPHLSRLHALMQQVPEFDSVHAPFLDFLAPFKQAQASGRGTTLAEFVAEARTGIRTVIKLATISAKDPNKKAKRSMRRGSTRELLTTGPAAQEPPTRGRMREALLAHPVVFSASAIAVVATCVLVRSAKR